ncbi:Bcr/CflA family efflux MFS transporter [Tessaracoccus rhinocerotis]|nr:Bcr/CflA family efflux MFS transporter [Tessaracoccus rhinocerotis]
MASTHVPSERTSSVPPGRLIVMLGLLSILGPLTIDLYLPAFPQIENELATTPFAVQLTLSGATLGFALGQLVVGPWSDSIGRRLPLLIGTGVHVAASVAIAASPDIEWLIVLRVLQGAGSSGAGVVAMAMIRDVAEGSSLIKGLARVALFSGTAPIVAPFLGAQLMHLFSWRGIFVVVAAYGGVVLVLAAAFIPETLSPERRLGGRGRGRVLRSYRLLLRDRSFVGVALVGGMMVSSVFAYLSTSSFMFQQAFGLAPQTYGLISGINGLMFVVGTQVSAALAVRQGPHRVLAMILLGMVLIPAALILLSWVWPGLAGVVIAMALFLLLAGGCGPCLSALGLAEHGERAGTAAALLGAANFGLAGVASPVVGLLGVTSFAPLGAVMAAAMLLANLAFWFMIAPRRRRPGGQALDR